MLLFMFVVLFAGQFLSKTLKVIGALYFANCTNLVNVIVTKRLCKLINEVKNNPFLANENIEKTL